jgi:hypothetical protein
MAVIPRIRPGKISKTKPILQKWQGGAANFGGEADNRTHQRLTDSRRARHDQARPSVMWTISSIISGWIDPET